MSEHQLDRELFEQRLQQIGTAGWRRGMTMPPMPPATPRRRLARIARRKVFDLRYRLSRWLDPC